MLKSTDSRAGESFPGWDCRSEHLHLLHCSRIPSNDVNWLGCLLGNRPEKDVDISLSSLSTVATEGAPATPELETFDLSSDEVVVRSCDSKEDIELNPLL